MLVVLDRERLETALVDVAHPGGIAMHVQSLRVRERQPPDEPGQVAVGPGPEHQMPVVRHHAVGEQPHPHAGQRLGQDALEGLVVRVSPEDPRAAVRPIQDVVNQPARTLAQCSAHATILAAPVEPSQETVPDTVFRVRDCFDPRARVGLGVFLPGALVMAGVSRSMSSRLVLAAGLAGLLAGCSPPSPQSKPSPAAPPAVVPAEALNALKEQDFDRAATLLAKFLETRPDSRLALALYARATQQQAAKADEPARSDLFRKSAGAARKLRDAYRPLSVDEARLIIQALYNDGSALARLGQPEQALEALSEAVDAGLDAPSLFDADADLDTLRSRPEFARLRHDATLGGAPRRLARNHPFPFGFRLPDARKKLVASDDLKGKVVVVNFWASWSPPCRREAPLLAELDRKYRARAWKSSA